MSRVRRSDGELTREKILDSAGELIAEQGLARTTNKAIASRAQVDLAAINYHFGGRDGLYLAVLSLAHRHYLEGDKLAELASSSLAPEEKLSVFLQTFISRMNEGNGWHGRVLAREILAPSARLDEFLNSEGIGKIQSVKKIISEVSGISEDDPDLLPCILSVTAPCLMMIVAGNRIPGPAREISAMQTQVLTDHFTRFSLAGLKAVNQHKNSG